MSISSAEKDRAIVLQESNDLLASEHVGLHMGRSIRDKAGLNLRLWAAAIGDPVAVELLVRHDGVEGSWITMRNNRF